MFELTKKQEAAIINIGIFEEYIKEYKNEIEEKKKQMPEWWQHVRKIDEFNKRHDLTQSAKDIVRGWEDKYINEYYISCTTEMSACENYASCKYLYENGYLKK